MGDFFGIVLFFVGIFFLFMVVSKVTGINGAFAEPDDLDNIYQSSRKLVDKKYKEFKEIEEKSLNEYYKYVRAFDNALMNRYLESEKMKETGIDRNIVEKHLNEKYDPFFSDCSRKKKTIKDHFEKLTGKKLKVDK